MSFMDDLRSGINKAPMGSKERNLLKVILGSLQNLPGSGKSKESDPTDAKCISYVNSFIENNKEFIKRLEGRSGTGSKVEELEDENCFLRALLPQQLSLEEIKAHLKDVDVVSPPKTGPAIGMAMGHFKKEGLFLCVKGDLVTQVVKEMRGE